MNAIATALAHASHRSPASAPRKHRRLIAADPLHRAALYVGTLVPAVFGYAVMQWLN